MSLQQESSDIVRLEQSQIEKQLQQHDPKNLMVSPQPPDLNKYINVNDNTGQNKGILIRNQTKSTHENYIPTQGRVDTKDETNDFYDLQNSTRTNHPFTNTVEILRRKKKKKKKFNQTLHQDSNSFGGGNKENLRGNSFVLDGNKQNFNSPKYYALGDVHLQGHFLNKQVRRILCENKIINKKGQIIDPEVYKPNEISTLDVIDKSPQGFEKTTVEFFQDFSKSGKKRHISPKDTKNAPEIFNNTGSPIGNDQKFKNLRHKFQMQIQKNQIKIVKTPVKTSKLSKPYTTLNSFNPLYNYNNQAENNMFRQTNYTTIQSGRSNSTNQPQEKINIIPPGNKTSLDYQSLEYNPYSSIDATQKTGNNIQRPFTSGNVVIQELKSESQSTDKKRPKTRQLPPSRTPIYLQPLRDSIREHSSNDTLRSSMDFENLKKGRKNLDRLVESMSRRMNDNNNNNNGSIQSVYKQKCSSKVSQNQSQNQSRQSPTLQSQNKYVLIPSILVCEDKSEQQSQREFYSQKRTIDMITDDNSNDIKGFKKIQDTENDLCNFQTLDIDYLKSNQWKKSSKKNKVSPKNIINMTKGGNSFKQISGKCNRQISPVNNNPYSFQEAPMIPQKRGHLNTLHYLSAKNSRSNSICNSGRVYQQSCNKKQILSNEELNGYIINYKGKIDNKLATIH